MYKEIKLKICILKISQLIILIPLLSSCDVEQTVDIPQEENISWGKLSGIWQSYYEGVDNKAHNGWRYIQDSGDTLTIYNCSSPGKLGNEYFRVNNVFSSNEFSYHEIISDSEIKSTFTSGLSPTEYGYIKIEDTDAFVTGSLSVDVIDDATGAHWPGEGGNVFCAQSRAPLSSNWYLDINTYTMSIEFYLDQPDYIGDFIVGEGLYMRIFNKTHGAGMIVNAGSASCDYDVNNDLHCVFNVSGVTSKGFGTAIGEFTINREYLTTKDSLVEQ